MLRDKGAFSIIELLLAVSILGITVLVLIGFLAPSISQNRDTETFQDLHYALSRTETLIQTEPYQNIKEALQTEGYTIYFHENGSTTDPQTLTQLIDSNKITGKIIKAHLKQSPLNTPKHSLAIEVTLSALKTQTPLQPNNKTISYISIKNA